MRCNGHFEVMVPKIVIEGLKMSLTDQLLELRKKNSLGAQKKDRDGTKHKFKILNGAMHFAAKPSNTRTSICWADT